MFSVLGTRAATAAAGPRLLLARSQSRSSSARQRSRPLLLPSRRLLSDGGGGASKGAGKEASGASSTASASASAKGGGGGGGEKKTSWWNSAELWGGFGAVAGWGMSGAAIYDAAVQGPEIISLNMTGVLIVYSSLFARWAYVVRPQNLLLCGCHVTNVAAQLNQMRRGLEHKSSQGPAGEAEVSALTVRAAMTAAGAAAGIALGPTVQSVLAGAELGMASSVAASPAGPFTVHFWAPMSKWFISGASFLDLHRPTDQISLAQYTALTLTGFFFSRYSLLVTPVNYTLCSVNVALFGSSAWHLGRKVNADFLGGGAGGEDEEAKEA